ncbi:MAG TPA: TIR domain-containing protein, partial [Ktedonobacteraceae bacterium]
MKSRKDMAVRSVHPIKIFYCYAHEDGELRERLERHLIPLRQRRDITGWFDLDIQAGSDWKRESEAHLDEADIILLLLSADFLASRYGETVEMTRALERHRTGMASIMPILLKPVSWELTPFAMFSPLPTNRKPVTSWANQEEAFLDIAQGIHRVIQTLLSKQAVSQEVSSQQGPLTGQVIGGKYRLGELLGEGGYGQVYKAWNLQLERIQAVKILHDWHFQKREFRERFTREARIVAVLDHPNIIHVDDFDVQSDRAYLVMPF